MKKYLYKKTKKIPIYKGKLMIIITNSSKKLKKKLIPDFEYEDIYAHVRLINHKDWETFAIILNIEYPTDKITCGTIAHEAFHVVNMLAERRNFIADFNNDEPLAYILDWITDEIYAFIQKSQKKTGGRFQ